MQIIKIGEARLEQREVDKQKCYSDSPYSEIITTGVPVNWYSKKDGSFDGISIGPSDKGFNSLELLYLERICEALLPVAVKIEK